MVDKPPLVSIIVPVYNGERFIDEALASALGQTHPLIEVIVVDDGSTDRTSEILDTWSHRDSRVRVVRQSNQGVAAARNRAIAESQGEFVAPMDADDLWDPTKIERQVQRMAECGEDVGLVYCWWLIVDENSELLDCSPRWRIEGLEADALVQVNFTGNSSVPLYQRRYLDAIGGYDVTLTRRDGDAHGCEDLDVALKVAEVSRVAVVPSYLVAYRKHRGTMSTATDRMWPAHKQVFAGVRTRRPDVPESFFRNATDQLALYLAGVSWWTRAYGQAVRWGLRGLRSTIGWRALPYIVRVVLRGRRSNRIACSATVRCGDCFSAWNLPAPLIPYDRLYERTFERLRRRA